MRRFILLAGVALVAALAVTSTSQAAGWKECGSMGRTGMIRISASVATSCPLARKVARIPVSHFYNGRRVSVSSPVTGRSYSFSLWFEDCARYIVRARGDHGSILKVRVWYHC